MSQKRCCFIGQRELEANVGEVLASVVEQHIKEYGVTEFVLGNNRLFDLLAAVTVGAAKIWHPKVKLYLMQTGCSEQERPLPNMEDFDDVIHLNSLKNTPREDAVSRLFQLMLQDSDYLIAYITDSVDETAAVLEQARERERQGKLVITNLGDFSNYLNTDMVF